MCIEASAGSCRWWLELSVCQGSKKLHAVISSVFDDMSLHLSLEVGNWCRPYEYCGNAICSTLSMLKLLHVSLSQVCSPGFTGISQYKTDKLPVERAKGLLRVV